MFLALFDCTGVTDLTVSDLTVTDMTTVTSYLHDIWLKLKYSSLICANKYVRIIWWDGVWRCVPKCIHVCEHACVHVCVCVCVRALCVPFCLCLSCVLNSTDLSSWWCHQEQKCGGTEKYCQMKRILLWRKRTDFSGQIAGKNGHHHVAERSRERTPL